MADFALRARPKLYHWSLRVVSWLAFSQRFLVLISCPVCICPKPAAPYTKPWTLFVVPPHPCGPICFVYIASNSVNYCLSCWWTTLTLGGLGSLVPCCSQLHSLIHEHKPTVPKNHCSTPTWRFALLLASVCCLASWACSSFYASSSASHASLDSFILELWSWNNLWQSRVVFNSFLAENARLISSFLDMQAPLEVLLLSILLHLYR